MCIVGGLVGVQGQGRWRDRVRTCHPVSVRLIARCHQPSRAEPRTTRWRADRPPSPQTNPTPDVVHVSPGPGASGVLPATAPPCSVLAVLPPPPTRVLLEPARDTTMSDSKLIHRAIRRVAGWAVVSFFSEIHVIGGENVPQRGPIIV